MFAGISEKKGLDRKAFSASTMLSMSEPSVISSMPIESWFGSKSHAIARYLDRWTRSSFWHRDNFIRQSVSASGSARQIAQVNSPDRIAGSSG